MYWLDDLAKAALLFSLHTAEIALLVFTATLIVGLFGEETKLESRKKLFALIVVASVIGELFSDAAIFLFSAAIEDKSNQEIAILQKRLLPRRLTSEQKHEVSEAIVGAPIGTQFEFSATTEEAISLAQSLALIFKKAGWKWIKWAQR